MGGVAVVLAIAGAVLPLLPTTPFLLVAAWAFARSSPRAERWLLDHARFGPLVRDWREGGAVSRSAKRASAGVMIATLAFGWAIDLAFWILAIQAVVFAGVSTFLWSRPEPPAAA
ncbi:MAG: YbaN family protein [Hyphomicrobiales bacterium]|nr:YbaN family protein [Hyphomicrobiales bacterium]